jgi:hypothetical protein
MARRVFFSFHYARDSVKVSQIRNAYIVDKKGDAQPFLDHAEWEAVQRKGDAAIQRWIDDQMKGSSVTVVLFGAETYKRPWVKYEILKSHKDGRGLLGISLCGMKGFNGIADNTACPNPFDHVDLGRNWLGGRVTYATYSWVGDDGRANVADWVEKAARAVGRA